MPNVLFLRAPQSPDHYESIFSAAGYKSSSVPVLETVLVNLEALTDAVRSGPQHGAVIITSSRACEAWGTLVDALESEQESHFSWSSIPFYVVGKSTATSLKAIREARPDSRFTPTDIRGESSGTSEQLANFILTDLESLPPSSRNKPFLYLTGDKNRDTLPNILRGGGVALSVLQVYQTQGSSKFPDDLKFALESYSHQDSDIWWIVFFAPSAAEFVTPFLRLHFDLGSVDATTSTRRAARVASIGPTTSAFLQDKLDIVVDAVASKPTQDDLLQVIRAYDRDRDG
ncbi:tetrapyrrole biosynthesis, uroporphyrinogen III synthase [Mycena albidolilacea]|uniref:Tetrapyrrole biosynthesis, uroporphyrinogen III synthase n=1 Tax=Mycena albidolilacea TaxID=1033008 RepID=A0AAD7ANF8_9AGAR|nr:tetrapyrrole biosynthesis, uroporphyrinogen III synthase [Mycena albidolilacea]